MQGGESARDAHQGKTLDENALTLPRILVPGVVRNSKPTHSPPLD
jgi:hypothetical protein